MHTAISLNNRAISQVQDNGDLQGAMSLFKESLEKMKSILVESNQGDPSRADIQDSHASHASISMESAGSLSGQLKRQTEDDGGTIFLFDRMLYIHCEPGTHSTHANEIVQLCFAVVVFNIALFHQCKCSLMSPSRARSLLFNKAAKLYQTCCALLDNIKDVPPLARVDNALLLLKIASLNNSAQICYEFQMYDDASDHLQTAASLLKIHGGSLDSYLSSHEFEGILANMYLLQPPSVAVAA